MRAQPHTMAQAPAVNPYDQDDNEALTGQHFICKWEDCSLTAQQVFHQMNQALRGGMQAATLKEGWTDTDENSTMSLIGYFAA